MKKISFRKNATVFRYLKEKKPVVKKRNYDRVIYFVILGLLLLFFGRYAFNKIFYIEAEGLVLMEKLEIRNIDDCRLVKIRVNEGDTVMRNDTLFTYVEDIDASQGLSNLSVTANPNSSWPQKEIATTEKNIELLKMDVKENQHLVANLHKMIAHAKNQVILGLLPKSKIESYELQAEELRFEIEKAKTEIDFLEKYLKQLRELETKTKGFSSAIANLGGEKIYLSPIDSGFVTSIYKKDFEVALKTEEIMTIHKHKEIVVKAFFDQSDIKYTTRGRKVTVEFPDGTTGRGIIKNILTSTTKLPEEFQKKYESTTRTIAVEIVPETEKELTGWNYFYKMSVKIYVVKYSFF
jgi:hypothetical protein